jgi:signal transduction histidine kinase
MSVAARSASDMQLPAQRRNSLWLDWLSIGGTTLALVLAALIVLYTAVLAFSWYSRPFIGVVTTEKLDVTASRGFDSSDWPGIAAGLRQQDRLMAISSSINITTPVKLDSVTTLNSAMSRLTTGETITLTFSRPMRVKTLNPGCPVVVSVASDLAVCEVSYVVNPMRALDFIAEFGLGFILALLLLGLGTYVFVMRRHQLIARTVALVCATSAVAMVGRFEIVTTYQLRVVWPLAVCALGGVLLQLAMTFPYPSGAMRRIPILQLVPLAFTVIGCALYLVLLNNPDSYDLALLAVFGVAILGGAAFLFSLLRRRARSSSAMLRDQATIVLLGVALALVPALLWLVTTLIERVGLSSGANLSGITFSSVYVMPSILLFPLSLTYAVFQYRAVDTDRIISEGLIYTALGAMLVVGYLLVTGAAYSITAGIIRPDNPVIIAGTLFLIALAFTPLRLRLERGVDEAFFRQRRAYEKRAEQFSRSLTASVELNDSLGKLKKQLSETVAPRYMFVFLQNSGTGEYEATADPETGRVQTDIHFAENSPMVKLLATEQSLLYIAPSQGLPPELASERARLAVLNTPVFVRLQSASRMNGFIALGPRADGSVYGYEDLRFVETLADQAASAFERAQMIIEARKNETELRVLAQVSTALNIVMDFDILLEFIYTQVDKVINAPNFYIALRDTQADELYYAFYQEEGERVPEREGYRWRMGRDLMSEVVRSQQPVKTDNYVQETQRRDTRLHIDNSSLRAWMGVPLNAGQSGALGCLAIATTDSAVAYTEDQTRIFWAIADLAATAIYKTRLFAQTEERARQMKALNDISSRLASEFENLDALLQVITESAIEILRGEAGSLLLREENSNDLIFQLAVGGAGQELVGSRIPAGSGIAGTVVETGRHVIVNDTQHDNRWYGDIGNDGQPQRFSSRAILAVPLTTREGVIGVLEVINKKDGTPFVDDDVNLLTAFAGQAAVAIENARLFQTTDKALEARVQQLDNMQRIDQELNRTLDYRRVVDLTIDNAMREAGADAGALVVVHEDPLELEIAGSIGYPEETLGVGQFYPITLGVMGKVYRTGQSSLMSAAEIEGDHEYVQMFPNAKNQLAVPLFTGNKVSGILLLESGRDEAFNMMTASFIQGLAEHANTAITNAQLFTRLEAANNARSQFVGFVAHELKNPMASIKGYAEVLLGGMTGALSEQQQNFIAVIRRNVVRMQQLVDDLRDLTAQETGNLTLKRAAINFNNVIVETLRPQQRAIDEKEQKVVLNYPETLPQVWGDELRLIQILTNFVSNANKYTPPGGTITIMAEHVPNRWDPNGAAEVVHCAVSDTGIGMSDEDLKKLFTAYWRSDNPRAKEQPGTGLGMTLTRGLVEAHGGKVWVESTLDVGTTFHMTVPLAQENEKESAR